MTCLMPPATVSAPYISRRGPWWPRLCAQSCLRVRRPPPWLVDVSLIVRATVSSRFRACARSGWRPLRRRPATTANIDYPAWWCCRACPCRVVCCFGTNPIQAARLRPDENIFQSPISATNPVAPIGPIPGISASRRLASHERCQAMMLLSMDPISAPMALYCRASTSRMPRTAGETPAIRTIRDDPEQLSRSITALGRHDAEFGQVSAQGIAQHRALTHQQLPGPVQHQDSLLLLRLDRDEPHRRPRDRLADRCRIIRIVLAAFEVSLT